ncbi:MAG: SRPBCC family protein [Acidimicrobiales bacterium]|nr:SRPBCC family protein [Acidimicrobiales bacterium]|tara:strand:- start:76 stop:660 length:585 start_codon:yes stop_codon:yes gene_type:complete
MELSNDFEVSAPIEKVWEVINDVELIAPCLPGAQLEEVGNDEYKGFVKVKVGPITAQYKGVAKFVEVDDSNHRVVIRGEGRDTRGAGNAAADITASLESVPEGTRVNVVTDLKITGKVAQFGRGVMADISKKLMGQFADNLSELVLSEDSKPASTGSEGSELEETEAIDLLSVAGGSIGKKLVPEWIRNRQKKT